MEIIYKPKILKSGYIYKPNFRIIENGDSENEIPEVISSSHPDNSLRNAVEKLSNFTQDRSNFRSNENREKIVRVVSP